MKEERKKFRIIEGIILIIILIGIISQCDFQNKNENIVNVIHSQIKGGSDAGYLSCRYKNFSFI